MRHIWIIGLVLVCIFAMLAVSLRRSTVRAISRIESLQGRTGEFTDITKTIRTRYSHVDSAEGLEHARQTLGLQTLSNLYVVRFNGEGLPYFYGFVAYDTNKKEIVRAVVDQLW